MSLINVTPVTEMKWEAYKPGRCKDCKWWGFKHPAYIDDKARCEKLTQDAMEGSASIHLETYEFEGLRTSPDFGCVHWEAKG